MSSFVILMVVQVIIVLYLLNFKKHLSNKQISIYSTIIFYLSIIALVAITKTVLRNQLDSFDANGDGFFNGEEINVDQQNALKKVSSDTNLILAPIVAAVYSILYFLILLAGLKIFRRKNIPAVKLKKSVSNDIKPT